MHEAVWREIQSPRLSLGSGPLPHYAAYHRALSFPISLQPVLFENLEQPRQGHGDWCSKPAQGREALRNILRETWVYDSIDTLTQKRCSSQQQILQLMSPPLPPPTSLQAGVCGGWCGGVPLRSLQLNYIFLF